MGRTCWLVLLLQLVVTKANHLTTESTTNSFDILFNGNVVFRHSYDEPAIAIGRADGFYKNDLGNFKISETLHEKRNFIHFGFVEDSPNVVKDELLKEEKSSKFSEIKVKFFRESFMVVIKFSLLSPTNQIHISMVDHSLNENINRFYLRLHASFDEYIYGGGEQYSYFNLRGHEFPMWGREQGVGRSDTVVSYLAEKIAGAGGDYHTTYWPQATFVSSRLYYMHLNYSYYNVAKFPTFGNTEFELWEDFATFELVVKYERSWPQLITSLTGFLGRQPALPTWVYNGAIIGVQGGIDKVLKKYNSIKDSGIKVSAIWIQDWSGKLMTSLGKRVYWNWYLSEEFYTWKFKEHAEEMKLGGVRYLAYINPHVIDGSDMYTFGDKHKYFIQNKDGSTHLDDFGDFHGATVDLTNPRAYKWYQDVLRDMADAGFSGWMADFGGEYLPVNDSNLMYFDKNMRSSAFHNYYNVLWAKMNREVVDENPELFIFMRSGYGESSGYAPSAWAGDQNVDFSFGDGLPSVIAATLSLGMSGMGVTHSDIGGYVSLICMVRTEELIIRWAEMSVFSPVMRTHEGNRPNKNWQVYTLNSTKSRFARLTSMYTDLAPYHKQLSKENILYGYPYQRPLFFHYPQSKKSYLEQYQYMYGEDLLVAPVLKESSRQKDVFLPPDDWVFLWDNEYSIHNEVSTTVTVPAIIGQTPVFYRRGSKWANLFNSIATKYRIKTPIEPQGLSWELFKVAPMMFIYLLLRKIFYYVLLAY